MNHFQNSECNSAKINIQNRINVLQINIKDKPTIINLDHNKRGFNGNIILYLFFHLQCRVDDVVYVYVIVFQPYEPLF